MTQVTEIAYPPIDSQATQTFIDGAVESSAQTGDLTTDFKQALYNTLQSSLSPDLGMSGYSMDDLWKRYIINIVAIDSNAETGNPAGNAGQGDPKGHRGNKLDHYYGRPFLVNPGNSNTFPTGGSFPDPVDAVLSTRWSADGTNADFALTNMVSYMSGALPRISDMKWSPDGTLLTVADITPNLLYTFICDTPWRPDTIPATGGLVSSVSPGTNPLMVDFNEDGDVIWAYVATDRINVAATADFTVPGTWTTLSTEIKNGSVFSFSGSSDGPVYITPDGKNMYWYAQDTNPSIAYELRQSSMATPWDLDTLTEPYESSLDYTGMPDSNLTNISSRLQVNNAGTEIIYFGTNGSVAAKGEFGTPHDVSTITWGTEEFDAYDNVWGTVEADGAFVDSRKKIWRWDSAGPCKIAVWDPA